MAEAHHEASLEAQIEAWRSHLRRRPASPAVDIAKLEQQLRAEVAGLARAGLADDEAFLVAVKRMGRLDPVAQELAREHSDRVWKQLGGAAVDSGKRSAY